MKKVLVTFSFLILCATAFGQTKEELQGQIAPKAAEIAKLQGEVNALKAKIDGLPGWRKALFGTIGGSLTEQRNAFAQGIPDNSSGNIGFTVNGYANLIKEKFFWRNSGTLNLSWVKLDNIRDATDSENFDPTTDIFTVSSLYGRNITKKLAYSALAEYRTTVLNNFNDPGYLDAGIGFTWLPIENLVVVAHPLNYNFVFSDSDAVFQSSLGAKVVVDYTKKIGAVNFKSNASAFISYEDTNLSNWAWNNSLAYTLWNKIGVGVDFGLRGNRQEAANFQNNMLIADGEDPLGLDDNAIDNRIQTYWTLGLSYAF